MDAVCDLIGNAVPPLYAKLVAKAVLAAINKRDYWKNGAKR
jgi:site-specific DNA-cytosine methylase